MHSRHSHLSMASWVMAPGFMEMPTPCILKGVTGNLVPETEHTATCCCQLRTGLQDEAEVIEPSAKDRAYWPGLVKPSLVRGSRDRSWLSTDDARTEQTSARGDRKACAAGSSTACDEAHAGVRFCQQTEKLC